MKNRTDKTYRPVASFCLLDKVIDCLTAKYLRETLDRCLLECSLAYRPRRDGRRDGLDAILRERQLHSRVFVAECDIQGFFDCVPHDGAIRALRALRADSALKINPRALEIFDAYLSCYSFLRNIRHGAELELKRRHPEAKYTWPEEDLRALHGSDLNGIGVPQGGALSGVIANAVLHMVDQELMAICKERGVTYLRFSDDMILLAPDRGSVVLIPAKLREALPFENTLVRLLFLRGHVQVITPEQYEKRQRQAAEDTQRSIDLLERHGLL